MKARSLKIGVLMIASVLLLTACGGSDIEQSGFDSPEAAVVAYLEGLQGMDLDRMMSAFAIETFVDNFDLVAHLEWVKWYNFYGGHIPNVNELARALNIERRRNQVSGSIRSQYTILTRMEQAELAYNLLMNHFQRHIPQGEANDFVRELSDFYNAAELHRLEILGFFSNDDLMLHELLPFYFWELLELTEHLQLNQEIFERRIPGLGADELVSRVAVFQLNEMTILLFADVVNYDGRWYLLELGGSFAVSVGLPWESYGLLLVPPEYMDYFDGLWENMITQW